MTPTEHRARALVDLLARHDWPAAEAGFNAKMSDAVPADKLASVWTELESNAGPWAGVDDVKLETKDSLENALVHGHFGPVRKRVRVVLDTDGRVAGLFIGPVPEEVEASTRDLVSALARGDFAGASRSFDATMRAALPPSKLAEAWNSVQAQVGAFVALGPFRLEPKGHHWVVVARGHFERGDVFIRVAYDVRNQVAGLFFLDGETGAAWTPPPYVVPGAFDEREVRVGSTPELPGMLAMPKRAGASPAMVLVHGSGPHDADETMGGVKVFKDLALGLASRGFATLRYAKRTKVAPAGVVTVKEEVIDAVRAALDLLSSTPGIDTGRLVVLGHSLGGYLAPRIAREDERVAGVIILAGPTRPLEDLVVEQARNVASLEANPSGDPPFVAEAEKFKASVEDPALTPDAIVRMPPGVMVTGAYFLDLRGYRPAEVAAALSCPMFVAGGGRDVQVSEADFAGWKRSLGSATRVTLRRYPAHNHQLVAGSGPSTPAEYAKPAHVDSALVDDLAVWLAALPARTARPGRGH
jgi:dienelactone hydrolase